MNRKWLQRGALLFIAFAVFFVPACSTEKQGTTNETTEATTEATTESTQEQDTEQTEPFDPMAPYDPPIEITTVRGMGDNIEYDEGQDIDNNQVYQAYEEDLGIKIKHQWVTANDYDQKVRISIASNDIPDFMMVQASEFYQLLEADMIMDLTDVYEKYASPETKALLTGDGGLQMETAKVDGKLMAIPFTDSPYNLSDYLWVRKDWLDQLKLPEPKTLQDVLKISQSFAEKNPGGADRTFGFGMTKDLFTDVYGLAGYFNGFHAYPTQWIEDEGGNLAYGSIQPQMKEALKQLQEMYKAGQIDPEFGVKDAVKVTESIANNQLGMVYGRFWISAWPMQSAVVKDEKVTQEWEVYPLPSIDGSPALTQVPLGIRGYYVVKKDAKNPEAAIKMLNRWVEIAKAPSPLPEKLKKYHAGKKDQQIYLLNPLIVYSHAKDWDKLPTAIQNEDRSILTDGDSQGRYDEVQKYKKGDASFWYQWMISKPGGSSAIMGQYFKEKRYHIDKFTGPLTPTMTERNATLYAKEQEYFTKIILNQVSIDEFDKFVEEWKRLGGDQITKEVNDWYASRK